MAPILWYSVIHMQSVSNDNFGPLVAYLVPGATTLWGVSQFSPGIQAWFTLTPANAPTISGLLYLTIVSLAVGMTITAIRWAVVDQMHMWTGLQAPQLDFSQLSGKVDAFSLLIEIHYRHYQFYANMFVATLIAYACYRATANMGFGIGWLDLGVLMLECVFFATSRDTLRKYYVRTEALLTDNSPRLSERRSKREFKPPSAEDPSPAAARTPPK